MKKKIFTLLTLLVCVCSGVWATDFTFDVSTDFNDLTDAQKDAIISNGIDSGDKLISISFSNPGTDFQRDGSGIKMRGASARNATITISGSIVATISKVILTYSGTKRNIVSSPSVTRTDNDANGTMTWSFDNVSSLTLSQNVGNTVLTKIEVTYSATDITATTALWDFQNGNPASLGTEAIGIEGKEADVTSSVSGIKMHVNAKTGKLNYRSANGDAQCNLGTVIQIPVKGTLDVVKLVPKSGGYTIAGGSEVTATTTYTATAADVAQGYVEIVCSTAGYLYSLKVVQYSASKTISAAGWATYCSSCPLDLQHATGLTDAFIVTGGEGGVLAKTSVKGGTVAANTGLLIKGDAGTATIPVVASGTDYSASNKLVGVTANTEIAANVGYVLMGSPSLGFYKNTNAFTVGANTAYLPAGFATDGARSFFSLFDDDVTGINAVNGEGSMVNGSVFNLAGQRVAQPTKGLYIVNGKKVVIK